MNSKLIFILNFSLLFISLGPDVSLLILNNTASQAVLCLVKIIITSAFLIFDAIYSSIISDNDLSNQKLSTSEFSPLSIVLKLTFYIVCISLDIFIFHETSYIILCFSSMSMSVILYSFNFMLFCTFLRRIDNIGKKKDLNITLTSYECPICKTAMNNLYKSLPCNHSFHKECINQWSLTQLQNMRLDNMSCPMCRKRYNIEYIDVVWNVVNQNMTKSEYSRSKVVCSYRYTARIFNK